MFSIPLSISSTVIQPENFWDAIYLYYSRPHLVNRKIIGTSTSHFYQVQFESNSVQLQDLFTKSTILYELRKLDCLSSENIKKDFLNSLLECYDKDVKLDKTTLDDIKLATKGVFVSIRILFPRAKNCPKAVEVVTFDKEYNSITFIAVSETDKSLIAPPFSYQIELSSSFNLKVKLNSFEDADTGHAEWLADKLFPKLVKWSEEVDLNGGFHSLSLINVEEYCSTYTQLKETHGAKLVQEWPKKSGTDPQKYVFEDIAIASYLICLWKNDSNVKFVDCGCGNGLLVYLLNQEGYDGYGIDVRRRPTWDIYPESTKLVIGTVGPESLFPDCTWIIGNHSDELTPWIPVMALKSHSNFFVLPCCPYDFNGQKFIRKNTSISVYADYMNYIESISTECGFETCIDKLRIPSTKRTCLVGRQSPEIKQNLVTKIEAMVLLKTGDNFVQRSEVEKVKNCTKVEKSLIANIVQICISTLLSTDNLVQKLNGELWNKGGEVEISTLIQEIPKDLLKGLKEECGGVQTVLRNHRYLFEIVNGLVKLRLPPTVEETTKYRDKPCWFEKNHPNKCLHSESSCGYKH